MDTIVRHRDEGQATWFLNGLMTTKVDAAETGGAYCLMEHVVTAASNPPMHVQTDEEEAFYVLEGEVEFEVDGQIVAGQPGFVRPRAAAERRTRFRCPATRRGCW